MLNVQKHRTIMYEILIALFELPQASSFAFKGGTLCYFIYQLDRFSTDIDIDCLKGLPDKKMQDAIEKILQKFGTIKVSQVFQHMHRYILSYGESDHNIKVEFNAKVWKANTYEIINFFGTPIQAMDKSTIFANKLIALINRREIVARDMRDIYFFFSHHFPINEKVIEERTQQSIKEFRPYAIAYIQKHFTSKNIVDANLGIVLDPKQKAWARKNLIPKILSYMSMMEGV